MDLDADRCAVGSLADPPNPRQQVLVDHQAALGSAGKSGCETVEPTEITRSRGRGAGRRTCDFAVSQRIQPGWRVFVNGKEQPLLTLDYLVMGVKLEAGHQVVEFRAPQSRQLCIYWAWGSLPA